MSPAVIVKSPAELTPAFTCTGEVAVISIVPVLVDTSLSIIIPVVLITLIFPGSFSIPTQDPKLELPKVVIVRPVAESLFMSISPEI